MKAISMDAHGGPEVLRFIETPEPTPGPFEVAIDVAYAGVGLVDTFMRRGIFGPSLPLIPGIEVSGCLRALGPGVRHLQVGQRVAAFLNDFVNLAGCGGYAQVALARADLTVPLQDNCDLADAASALMNGTTAMLAVRDVARARPSENVLVLGATGGLGSWIGRVAQTLGVERIIGVIGNPSNRTLAEQIGYTEVTTAAELAASQPPIAGAEYDVVFDTVGGELRRIAFERLAPQGRMIILGNASGVDQSFSADQIWHGTKTVMGLSLGGIAHLVPERITSAARDLFRSMQDGKAEATPARVIPLAQAAQAHGLLEARQVSGKIILRV
jgi:NADPH:quinone reductase